MPDLTELRRLLDEAPSRPWRYQEGAKGDPYGGPDYTALEAQHPQNGWTAIATGEYDSFCGYGLILAAEAVNALPDLLDAAEALERVKALHEQGEVFVLAPECADEACGHEDCPTVPAAVCMHCYDIGLDAARYAYEDGGLPLWPCLTLLAIDGEPQP